MVLVPLLLPLCSLEPGSFRLMSRANEPASALSRLFKADATVHTPDASWARVASTWDTAHTAVHTASKSALFHAEEQGDAVGSDAGFEKFVGFRSLEEASGSGSGSDSGSGEAGSGVVAAPALPPPPPPPSPLAPGSANMVVNKTIITVTMTIAGDVSDFNDAAQTEFKAGLRANVCDNTACPGVEIALTIAAGSVKVTSAISYREDDNSVGAAVQTKAEGLASATTATLTALLGVTVESAPTVSVAKNVQVTVTVPAPNPPPPTPSLPPPPSPSEPGSGEAEADDDSGMATWMIAVIAAAGGLVVLALGLAVYKYKYGKKSAGADYGTEMAKRGDFPLAIGASTTQHV